MHADFVAGERVPVSKTFPAHITMVEFDFFYLKLRMPAYGARACTWHWQHIYYSEDT